MLNCNLKENYCMGSERLKLQQINKIIIIWNKSIRDNILGFKEKLQLLYTFLDNFTI